MSTSWHPSLPELRIVRSSVGYNLHDRESDKLLAWFSEDGAHLLRYLRDDNGVMTTSWGGVERGCVVTERLACLDPEALLIGDSEVKTVREIRALAGKGKKRVDLS